MKAMKVNPKLDLGWILGLGRTIPARFALGPGYHDRNSRALPQGLCRSILFFVWQQQARTCASAPPLSVRNMVGVMVSFQLWNTFFFCLAAGEDLPISSTFVNKKQGGGAWVPSNYGMPNFLFLAAAGEDLRISSTSVSKKHGGGAWFP